MEKNRTIRTIIINECANYDNGVCLGVDIRNHGFNDTGKCLVLVKKPCPYFEECLIPDIKDQKIIEKYGKINEKYLSDKKRKCNCGAPLRPRHRYCPKCAKKHRQQSWKRSKKRARQKCDSISTIKQDSSAAKALMKPNYVTGIIEKYAPWYNNTKTLISDSLTVDSNKGETS